MNTVFYSPTVIESILQYSLLKDLKCYFCYKSKLFRQSGMDSADSSCDNYTTPLKSDGGMFNTSKRQYNAGTFANPYKTPVRCNESVTKKGKLGKCSSFKSSIIKKMPVYATPPQNVGLVKNPFEHSRYLKERLSQPMCSPSLFENISAVQDNPFSWSIEEISDLRPAAINENPSQEFNSWFSPATEYEAQNAINNFFSSQIVNMDSPVIIRPSRCSIVDKSNEVKKTESWSQTTLSLPPVLPPDVEKILAAYYIYDENKLNQDCDLNSSNGSVSRKKLLFDSLKEDLESRCNTSIQNQCKQKVASTPIKNVLSSPELSPIPLDKLQDSPMDISVIHRSKSRLNGINDTGISTKENIGSISISMQENDIIVKSPVSVDSAFIST